MKTMYVYIVSNRSRTLYIGVTNDLQRRMAEHKRKSIPGFTAKYNITQLVYYEEWAAPLDAISREKALKGLLRWRKIELIEDSNPTWKDLSAEW